MRYNPAQEEETANRGNGEPANLIPITDTPTPRLPDSIPTPAPAKKKKVTFGAIAQKKEDTQTAYPVLVDATGEAAKMAARIIDRGNQVTALEAAIDTDKDDLRQLCALFYFVQGQGKSDVPSSISVPSDKGEVLVCFQNRYKGAPDDSALIPIFGDDVDTYFRQSFDIKISGDKLPEDSVQELVDELQALFIKHRCPDALSRTESIKPNKDFHQKRHLLFSPEQNLAIDGVAPIVIQVKTKGRKKA